MMTVAALALAGALMGSGAALAQDSLGKDSPITAKTHKSFAAVGVSLNDVRDPKRTLADTAIQDENGDDVGHVAEVVVDSKGKPIELKVDVGSYLGMTYKLVSMKATDFKFDKDNKTLVTRLTKRQIHVIAGG
jgi:sporulation protein YlmC with PRC-barrel domain